VFFPVALSALPVMPHLRIGEGRIASCPLILASCSVTGATELAKGRRFGVVNAMLYGFERANVGKDGFLVFVGEVPEIEPGHDLVDLPCFDVSGAYHFQEERFVIIGDAGGVRSDIGARHSTPRTFQDEATAEFEASNRLAFRLRRVAIRTACDGHQVFAALHWR